MVPFLDRHLIFPIFNFLQARSCHESNFSFFSGFVWDCSWFFPLRRVPMGWLGSCSERLRLPTKGLESGWVLEVDHQTHWQLETYFCLGSKSHDQETGLYNSTAIQRAQLILLAETTLGNCSRKMHVASAVEIFSCKDPYFSICTQSISADRSEPWFPAKEHDRLGVRNLHADWRRTASRAYGQARGIFVELSLGSDHWPHFCQVE